MTRWRSSLPFHLGRIDAESNRPRGDPNGYWIPSVGRGFDPLILRGQTTEVLVAAMDRSGPPSAAQTALGGLRRRLLLVGRHGSRWLGVDCV